MEGSTMSGIEDTCVLRKQYGREGGLVRAVDGVDLDVAAGRTLAVMGPSSCGKPTLLHLLGGLDRPTAGELFFEDRRVDQLSERALAQLRRHEIGFVFQAFQLLDELTAQENVDCRPYWPDHHHGRLAAGPTSSLSKSDWGNGPATCLPRFPAGNASASPLRERWSTSRPSSSLTNRPGTSTAPPRWKCSGFSAPCAPRGSPWWSSPTTSGSPRRRIG